MSVWGVMDDIKQLMKSLNGLDRDLGIMENHRARDMANIKSALRGGQKPDDFDLILEQATERVAWQKDLIRSFALLEAAVANTRDAIARFDKIASKDEDTLNKAAQIFSKIKPMGKDDPVLKKQRAAMDEFEKSVEFAESAFQSLADLSSGKLGNAVKSDGDLKRAFDEIGKTRSSARSETAFKTLLRGIDGVRGNHTL